MTIIKQRCIFFTCAMSLQLGASHRGVGWRGARNDYLKEPLDVACFSILLSLSTTLLRHDKDMGCYMPNVSIKPPLLSLVQLPHS